MFKHLLMVVLIFVFGVSLMAQEVDASKAKNWSLSGRVQLQHLYDNSIDADAVENNNGFRMRRTRLQVKAKLTDWVSGKIQIEIRDNNPALKDAEAKVKLFDNYALRLGQFKVPVWREELRSSGSLYLVERSHAAEFLVDNYLSARHIGLELSGSYKNGIGFAVNYSNGTGEGGREDAGRTRYTKVNDTTFVSLDEVNNGKLYTARINIPIKKIAEIGLSVSLNQLGNEIAEYGIDNKGNVYVIAPDFGLYFPFGLDVEGGVAIGAISKDLIGSAEDEKFNLFDVTAQWKKALDKPIENLGGLDAFGFAGGISYIEPDTETDDNEMLVFRFGPVIYFGKQFRFQVNGEVEQSSAPGSDDVLKIRSQFTLNL
ncbi:MAG: hypothetical protein JW956_10985 [Calditrichaceae bacterium]|nr:hypothetical protein [Calditrichaceae bacterium]HES59751.1 hypothetical protein [Caldithrix sp.]